MVVLIFMTNESRFCCTQILPNTREGDRWHICGLCYGGFGFGFISGYTQNESVCYKREKKVNLTFSQPFAFQPYTAILPPLFFCYKNIKTMNQSLSPELHLLDLLELTESSGKFAANGHFCTQAPGLWVDGLGFVGLPLIASQAKALIALCEQAPFGRGEETVTDTSIRNCWQLDASKFEVRNVVWHSAVERAAAHVAHDLGLGGSEVVAEPYKLLVYEQGSFFVRHRDTEKMPSMFATMVVGLPSEHQGGELIISHGDTAVEVSFANTDGFSSEFAGFYADCYHEVKVVESGYRLCLVYNLAIKSREVQPLYGDSLAGVNDVAACLGRWVRGNDERPMLAYLLDHSYTEANLSMANLKGGDYGKVEALIEAAKRNECEAYLCLVTYRRLSYGEVPYSRYHYEPDEDDFHEFDVEEEYIEATHLIAGDGQALELGVFSLSEEHLVAKVSLFDGPGRECSIEEATGNAGASKDLWYHRGAVIVWPKAREMDVMRFTDSNFKAHYVAQQVAQGALEDAVKRAALWPLLIDAIDANNSEIEQVLLDLADEKLFLRWFERHMHGYSLKGDKAYFVKLMAQQIGWHVFDEQLTQLLSQNNSALQWLNALVKSGLDNQGKAYAAKWFQLVGFKEAYYAEALAHAIECITLLKTKTHCHELIAALRQHNKIDFVTKHYGPAVIQAVEALKGHEVDEDILKAFVQDVHASINRVFAVAPEPPKDWARQGKLNCSCEFCNQINEFLPDPSREQLRMEKTFKKNIVHVSGKIDYAGVDLDVELSRMQPRFLGVFSKNQNAFERYKKAYEKAQQLVAKLPQI